MHWFGILWPFKRTQTEKHTHTHTHTHTHNCRSTLCIVRLCKDRGLCFPLCKAITGRRGGADVCECVVWLPPACLSMCVCVCVCVCVSVCVSVCVWLCVSVCGCVCVHAV